MDVAFRLTRREPTRPDAFLLFAQDFNPLAAGCAGLGRAAMPDIYPVAGGFLIVPKHDGTEHLAGAIRLRRLGGELFVPADAGLLPALLPDELSALTKDWGLVILPGGGLLAFDPRQPLVVERWLAPARIQRGWWEPFPGRPEQAERLTTIERPVPPNAALLVLRGGEPDERDPLPGAGETGIDQAAPVPEDARPPSGPPLKNLVAGAVLGAGRFLAWLGRALRVQRLARAGANLARKAIEQVPRLTEKILGAQEAALREVLRQLRSGDVEQALRRAPIAVADPDVPARVGTDARLGTRDPRYSLRDLIATGGSGAIAWLGGGDIWVQLAQEYRRLAQEAAQQGDFRRAAYLYGVLLRDLRSAANVLMSGGLYRDAAVLLRDRLHDEAAAAAAFELAGDYEEALRLYVRLEHFDKAAELLRRLGDEDRAVAFFLRAADGLASAQRYLAAGDLVRAKVGRRDLAARYYRQGWETPLPEAEACGERLLDEYLVARQWPELHRLLDEAEVLLAPPHRSTDAGWFFTHALEASKGVMPESAHDDLADRVRLLFAGHVRSLNRTPVPAGELARELFSRGNWPGPVVRDATFAARKQAPPAADALRAASATHGPVVKLAEGTVVAVTVARATFDLVVATTSAVVCWRVDEGAVVPVLPAKDRGVIGVSADAKAQTVYVLSANHGEPLLRYFTAGPSGSFQMGGQNGLCLAEWGPEKWYLQPWATERHGQSCVTLANPDKRIAFTGPYLSVGPDPLFPNGNLTYLLAITGEGRGWDWDETAMVYVDGESEHRLRYRWAVPWVPAVPPGSSLRVIPVDWIAPASGVLELTGMNQEGALYWSEFDSHDGANARCRTLSQSHPEGFLASCLVAPGRVAAATRDGQVHWLRATAVKFTPWAAPHKLAVPGQPVALVARPHANEVVAVLDDGTALKIRLP